MVHQTRSATGRAVNYFKSKSKLYFKDTAKGKIYNWKKQTHLQRVKRNISDSGWEKWLIDMKHEADQVTHC